MIDPSNVTNFNRTASELEEFLLFTIVVAGKSAYQQAEKLDDFLKGWRYSYTPFGAIRKMDMWGSLEFFLKQVKMGQYQRISSAFRGVADFFQYHSDNIRFHPLATVPVRILESVKGIGMKTSRFFVMHTRPTSEYACLDTHILQWLGNKGHNVPKTTPSGQKYLELEKVFLDYANRMGMLPATLDLQIWNEAQSKKT
jgi:thermostable 8-oxoguanine DNA glycosylase